MKYQLISKGRLLEGMQEAPSIEQIGRLTGLSEERIRQTLLSGRPAKLMSASSREKLMDLHRDLREAGLEVEIVSKVLGWKRLAVASLVVLLLAVVAVAAFAWHWLHRPFPAEVASVENALFDEKLVAIGVIDVEKLVALDRYWFGDLDAQALPVDEQRKRLLDDLFRGPANFRENLGHVLLSLSLSPEGGVAQQLMLLSGSFETKALLQVLDSHYRVEQIADDHWALNKKVAPQTQPLCKKDDAVEQEVFYLRISPAWVMLSSDRVRGEEVWPRLRSNYRATQDLTPWRNYRKGRLMSFMAMTPGDIGKSLGGMPGMAVQGAVSEAPQIDAFGAALEIDLLQGELHANLHIMSDDVTWNRETGSAIRQRLDRMAQDGRSISPTLAELLSRLSVDSRTDSLDINLALDSEVIDSLQQIVQEGMSSLFSIGTSSQGGAKPREKINENPRQYVNRNLTQLPPYKDQYQSNPPLFQSGPFTVDLKSIKPNDKGALELWLEGKVGLPTSGDQEMGSDGKFSISVASVQDGAGNELLRDERCLDMDELGVRRPNHEEESNTNHHQDHGWVWKYVRLNSGVSVEQIQRIAGSLSFSMPTHVRRFEVPLRAGEVVEHAGLRFYLSSIKESSVSYQTSGESGRLLEIRGLNKEGRTLRQSWRMGDPDTQRFTQSFEGEVHGLELYVAERFFRSKADFVLSDIFRPAEKKAQAQQPLWFAPEGIEPKQWHDYGALDLDKLKIDPNKDWQVWGGKVTQIAQSSWASVKMFITHTPKQWGNSPMAHIYFPQLPALPGVLSAMSYRIDEPAEKEGSVVRYHKASYWYHSKTGEVVVKHSLEGKPIALNNISLVTGLGENQKLERLKGEIIFRLPKQTRSTRLRLNELWEGKSVDGVRVVVMDVSRGMFPGYGLKIEGEIEKLVNLHGLSAQGEPVAASPVNYQNGGYWTMTLPFGEGIEEVELVTAMAQEVLRYPFDLSPTYPAE
ncbi:MAG: hypothetical protein ABW092_04380 [Candidatus Thiodiazotropha sp.]